MKRKKEILLYSILSVLGIFVISCSKTQQITAFKQTILQNDSILEATINYHTFSSNDPETDIWLTMINDSIKSTFINTQNQVYKFSKEDRAYLSDGFPPYQVFVEDTLYQVATNMVSVRFLIYTFTGGAHGNTSIISYNLLPDKKKKLEKADIFKNEEQAKIDALLSKYFKNQDSCFSMMPTLELASVVNFSKDSVFFTYENYVLGPYSCGRAEVSVPIVEIKSYLKEQ